MSSLLSLLFRLAGFGSFGYGVFIIVKWYVNWISYYFIGDIKISLIAGLATFFLSPLAVIIDMAWHSMPKGSMDAAIIFAVCIAGGRILMFTGEKLGPRN
jgi:hypothetical protein